MRDAFGRGTGAGLLQLGAAELATELPPSVAWFRELGRLYLTRLCRLPGLEEARERVTVPWPAGEAAHLLEALPLMKGAEYLDAAALEAAWSELEAALRAELAAWTGTVQSWLQAQSPVWNLVGRVCFHLAENKSDEEHPFAFLATYAARLTASAKVQHRPLAEALEQSSQARDKSTLLALLGPVERAARSSPLLRALVDSGELFEPLAWTPEEAHRFLRDIPGFEAAGVVVRVPDWWKARTPPRLEVGVTVGAKAPSALGMDALLDFSVAMTVDGEPLSEAEWKQLRAGSAPLALIRGRWVEVDRDKLSQLLAHWKKVQTSVGDGLSFAEAMRLLAGAPLGGRADEPAEEARAWTQIAAGDWLAATLAGLRSPDALAPLRPGGALRATLRPYQEVGVRWLELLGSLGLGACLADDMGLGKTVQVLALLLLRQPRASGASLLVVPASLIGNWQAELERFAPSLRALVAHPSALPPKELAALGPEGVAGADLVITTYGTVARLPWLKEVAWQTVILDEAQAIKNPAAKQTRACKALPARSRVALTGTPIENRLGDLWSLFDFLNPGLLGSAKQFTQLTRTLASRPSEPYAPLRRLISPYILRRLKSDRRVIADLPDKTELRAFCALTRPQAALYQEAVDELKQQLGASDGIKRRGLILAFLVRFKQICNHPSHWLGDGVWAPDASGKLLRLAELAEAIAARQEKVLVFTQFREMVRPLAQRLEALFGRRGLTLDGDTPIAERRTRVARFQEDEAVPFFVLSVKAGGTGLNLTAASHVIHFDRWWNPAVENQATDRAFRIGQKKNVLVHKLVCRGTVEEKIDALIESKTALSKDLIDGGAEVLVTELGDAELLDLVRLDIGRAMAEA